MGNSHTRTIWILRLIAIVTCLLGLVSCEDWNKQFTEMKTMMTLLDAKISSMDSRLSNLNILEYAFKMNTIDNSLSMLNTRVEQMATQIDSIKDSLRNLPSSPCTQPAPVQIPQHSRSSIDEANVVQKLDDYGKKLLQSHQDIKTASEEHHQSLTAFVEVVRSGFSKVIAKVDSVLALEGEMSTLISLVRQLSATTNIFSDQFSNTVMDITEMKISVTDVMDSSNNLEGQMSTITPLVQRLSTTMNLVSGEVSNSAADITAIKRSVSNFTSKAFEEIVADLKNSLSFPVSELEQALQESRQLQLEMGRLTSIEDKVVKAASLSSRLLATGSLQSLSPEEREMAQNLTEFLSEIKNVTVPLFYSLPYSFDHVQAIIGDSFRTLANRTQCRSDESVKLEIARLADSISKQQGVQESNSNDVFEYCRDIIQDMVLRGVPDSKRSLLKLLSHLKILVEVNKGLENPHSNEKDWDVPLRSLFG